MAESNPETMQSIENVSKPGKSVSHFIELFRHLLISPCDSTMNIHKASSHLRLSCIAPDDSLPRSLLQAPFQVWFAYSIAHHQGSADGIEALPPSDIAILKEQVASFRAIHATVAQLASFLFQGTRGATRLAWLEAANKPTSGLPHPSPPLKRPRVESISAEPPLPTPSTVAEVTPTPAMEPVPTPAVSQHVDVHNSMSPSTEPETVPEIVPETAPETTQQDLRRLRAETFLPLLDEIGFQYNPRFQFIWPSASNLGLVFPEYLARAIVTRDGQAWLKASFDPCSCELQMFILATETQHVVKELFDIHAIIKDNRRSLLLENDVLIALDASSRLSGAPPAKLAQLLGPQTTAAYLASSTRAKELSNGQSAITRCLSLEVWPLAKYPSLLRLQADARNLSLVTALLWPGMRPLDE